MDKPCSDCDSNLSLDSLECENAVVPKSKSACKKVTLVPYYSGEVLFEDIAKLKHGVKTPPKCLNSKIPTKLNKAPFKSHSTCMNLSSELKPNEPHSLRPTFTYFADEKPPRAIKARRISRRTILPEEQTIRHRHRSVSYVEQFRKKMLPSQKLQASTLSIADSGVYQSHSLESWGNRDSGLGTSEFEFCDDIMFQTQSTQIDLSLSELNDESEKFTKTPKKNKTKTVILKRVDISGSEKSGNKLIEKKSSVEKREEYATKVKLRNQINFNRQKDRELIDKSLKKRSSLELHYKDQTGFNENIQNNNAIPFTHPLDVLGNNTDSPKTKKHVRRKLVKQKKKPQIQDEDKNIEMLRKRHELEKQLVNSLRQLIIKT